MAIDKIFDDKNVDSIADNIFNAVNNSVSEVKQMQQRKAAENAQMVVQSLKKIDTDIRQKYDNVTSTLEKRIITIKDGRDGINGKDGRDGKDGKNGRDGKDGAQGPQGPKGKDGVDGIDGVSVANANIDFDGSLIIALSNGREINVGEVVSTELQDRIKVITSGGAGGGGGSGTVTSVAATVPAFLSVTGSPITTSGTLAISLSGTALPVANGGTGGTTASTARSSLLPTYASNAGKVLAVNAGATDVEYISVGGSGTVTSVGGTGTVNGLTLTGTVTTSGNLTLGGTLDLSAPPAIGGTTPAAGAFTTLTASTPIGVASGGTGITSFGTGIATFLGTPSSANLAAAVTDETGTGALVFATSPTFVTPILGTPTSATLTNATGLPLSTGVTGTLPNTNGGTGQSSAFTQYGVTYAATTTALATTAAGTAGHVLTSNGSSAPTFQAPSGVSTGKAIAMAIVFGG
jgi:hypothetical protein